MSNVLTVGLDSDKLESVSHDLLTNALTGIQDFGLSKKQVEDMKQKLREVFNYNSKSFSCFDLKSKGYILCARNAYLQLLLRYGHDLEDALCFSKGTMYLINNEFPDFDLLGPLNHFKILMRSGKKLEAKIFADEEIAKGNTFMETVVKSTQFKKL